MQRIAIVLIGLGSIGMFSVLFDLSDAMTIGGFFLWMIGILILVVLDRKARKQKQKG